MSKENLTLTQGTPEWLEWRKKGIGSSEAPIIMGVSPYKTRLDLYRQKLGLDPDDTSTYATEKGHQWEPKARAAFELINDGEFPPALIESEEEPWLRCSLDGRNPATGELLEIKVPGAEDHDFARRGHVPDKYVPQVQYQLMLTGAPRLFYWSYYVPTATEVAKGMEPHGRLVVVEPDVEYQAKLLAELRSFWFDHVLAKKPPALMDDDVLDMASNDEFFALCVQLKDAKADKAAAEYRYKAIMEKIDTLMPHKKCRAAGVLFTRVFNTGKIDYTKVRELKGVDLEPYRGANYWSLRPTFPKE